MSEKETSSHDAAIGPYVRDGAPIGDDSKRCDRCEKTHPVEWSFGHECDLCPDCAVDGLRSEVSRLEAAVQEQAALVGKDIDAHDKLVMEKRGLEVDNDRLTAKCARKDEALRGAADGFHCIGQMMSGDPPHGPDDVPGLASRFADEELAAALSDDPPLAVVEGMVHGPKFIWKQSYIHDDRLAVWRPSKCDHPGWLPVTCIILPRPAADLPEQGE